MMDYEKIKKGVELMLEGIGEDISREGLLETPDRIARMCSICSAYVLPHNQGGVFFYDGL